MIALDSVRKQNAAQTSQVFRLVDVTRTPQGKIILYTVYVRASSM
jgi:hypothetical protein